MECGSSVPPPRRNSTRPPTAASHAPSTPPAALPAAVAAGAGRPHDTVLRLPHTYRRRALVQIGIVDVLQAYDVGKRVENAFKSMRYTIGSAKLGAADISSVDPAAYATRFTAFVAQIFLPLPGGFVQDLESEALPSFAPA